MGHAELFVTWLLLGLIGTLAAVTCWGVWKVHTALQAFRQQLFGYRDNLD